MHISQLSRGLSLYIFYELIKSTSATMRAKCARTVVWGSNRNISKTQRSSTVPDWLSGNSWLGTSLSNEN